MARPLRISYQHAYYHVTCRGNDRRVIFRDDHDRTLFLEKLPLSPAPIGVKSLLLTYTRSGDGDRKLRRAMEEIENIINQR